MGEWKPMIKIVRGRKREGQLKETKMRRRNEK
jgi:hypothetical protein